LSGWLVLAPSACAGIPCLRLHAGTAGATEREADAWEIVSSRTDEKHRTFGYTILR